MDKKVKNKLLTRRLNRFATMFLRQSLVLSVLLSTALGSGKRGLAANDDVPISGFGGEWNGNPSQVTWQYNWDSDTKQKQDFAEFVPMLWGPANIHTAQWRTNAQWWVSNSAQHLLGFNEPEQQGQSNLSVSQAVDAWRDWMEDFSGVAKLGAPSVSNDGYEWLSQFLQACSGCHIDFIPIHWYNDHSIEFDLEDWVNKICDLGDGRPVWITEVRLFQGSRPRVHDLPRY